MLHALIPSQIKSLLRHNKIDISKWKLTGKSLLNRDAIGNWKFAHKSILEYFIVVNNYNYNDEQIISFEGMNFAEELYREITLFNFHNQFSTRAVTQKRPNSPSTWFYSADREDIPSFNKTDGVWKQVYQFHNRKPLTRLMFLQKNLLNLKGIQFYEEIEELTLISKDVENLSYIKT